MTDKATLDLSACDREPIHKLGRIQSFGALLVLSADWVVTHASENIEAFLGAPADALIGSPLRRHFSAQAVHDIRGRAQILALHDSVERIFGVRLSDGGDLFDIALHISGDCYVLEIERHETEASSNYLSNVRMMTDRLRTLHSPQHIFELAAAQMQALTGFARVMIYRFAPDGSGEVIAEACEPRLESYRGLRYPASDIPKQARALYKRNLLRIISDVNDEGAAILPRDGDTIDLTLSTTRAVSPIHIQYLRNMGVTASMSVSIIRDGELWGLISCHHDRPLVLSFERRTAADLYGQLFSFLLDQMESENEQKLQQRASQAALRLQSRLEKATIADETAYVFDEIGKVIHFDSAAAWLDGELHTVGDPPAHSEIISLLTFLKGRKENDVYCTDRLSRDVEAARAYEATAAGLLSMPISRRPCDYLLLFRQEEARAITWGGDPNKPVLGAQDTLSPRKSFEAWKEIARGASKPWAPSERVAASSLQQAVLAARNIHKPEGDAEALQALLIAELNHRVRNIIGLIRSLVVQSRDDADDISGFLEIVTGRIEALANAHNQINRTHSQAGSLVELIETEAAPFVGRHGDRLAITGPEVLIEARAFTTVSLVVHEMVTNSAKYGAFSRETGRVNVTLERDGEGALIIEWRESGGPPVAPPSRRGFGSTIIEKSIPFDLGGRAALRFEPSGLRAAFVLPASYVRADRRPPSADNIKALTQAERVLDGVALVVEDNLIVGLDAENILRELGAEKVVVASNVADALLQIERLHIDFALLDVNLGMESSDPVAQRLMRQGTPFAFATGYDDARRLSEAYPQTPIVMKPFNSSSVRRALEQLGL